MFPAVMTQSSFQIYIVCIMLGSTDVYLYLCSLSPGTYAVMSVMIGGVIERLAPDSNFMIWDNMTNSSIVDTLSRDAERVKVAAAVTFMSGLIQVNI